MYKTATEFCRGHRSRTLLNLLESFLHSPTFWKRSSSTPYHSSCFHFRSCPLVLLESFPITSRRPCWTVTKERRPCWCPQVILWELNSILMQTLSFVFLYKQAHRSREWKHSIFLISYVETRRHCHRKTTCQSWNCWNKQIFEIIHLVRPTISFPLFQYQIKLLF